MSRRTATVPAVASRVVPSPLDWGPERVAGGAAATAIVAMALLRLAVNAPADLPAAVTGSYGAVEWLALAVPAAAALGLGVATDEPLERVGLVAVGVFGLLAALTPLAEVPAAGAVVAGGAVAVATRLPAPTTWRTARPALVAATVLAGAAVSLAGATGLVEGARAVGAVLALLGLAAAPVLVPRSRSAWLLGAVASLGVVAVAVAAPFVTGAVTLVVFAVVGVPLLVVALGTAGGVTALAGAVAADRTIAALGAVCLLAAGVPATVPRALAVTLGLVLLVGGGRRG